MSKKRLMEEVIRQSNCETADFEEAKLQWDVIDVKKAKENESLSCVCGKTNLKICFVIRNRCNKNVINNVGRECVRHFDNNEMMTDAYVFEMGLTKRVPFTGRFACKTYAESYELCKYADNPLVFAMNNHFSKEWLKYMEYVRVRNKYEE